MPKVSRPPQRVDGRTALDVRMGLQGVRLGEWPSIKGQIRRLVPDYLEPGKLLEKQDPAVVRLLIKTICDKFSHFGFQEYQDAWPVRDYLACYCRSRVLTDRSYNRPSVWPKRLLLPRMPSTPNTTQRTRDVNYAPDSQGAPGLDDDDSTTYSSCQSVHERDADTVPGVIDMCSDDDPPMPHPPVHRTDVKMEQEPDNMPHILEPSRVAESHHITVKVSSTCQSSKEAPNPFDRFASGAAATVSRFREPPRTPCSKVQLVISAPSRCMGTSRSRGRDDVARFLGTRPRPLLHLLPFLHGLGINNEDDLAELARMKEHNAWLDDAAEKHNLAARPGTTTISPFDLLRLKTAISAVKEEAGKENLLTI